MVLQADIALIQDAALQRVMLKCWEGSGLDSDDEICKRTGDHTPPPATILLHRPSSKGALASVASGMEDLGSDSDVSSGVRTPPHLEALQRFLEMHLKQEPDRQSAPPEVRKKDSKLQVALPSGLDGARGAFTQNSPQWAPIAVPSPTTVSPCPPSVATAEATKLRAASTIDQTMVPSVGSQGHPYNCAPACKYVKKKGGCRMGANCDLCHLCFWQRRCATQGAQAQLQELEVESQTTEAESQSQSSKAEDENGRSENCLASLGSQNHPFGCAPACKYVRRKGGCRDGAKCPNCHECCWQRAQANSRSSSGLLLKSMCDYSRDIVDVSEKLINMQMEKAAVKVDIADLASFAKKKAIKVSLAEELINTQMEKAAVRVDVADLAPFTKKEPVKVSFAESSWLTKFAELQGSNATQAEVLAQGTSAVPSQKQLPEGIPSIGSMGHPFSCKAPCKYFGKNSGCKDGTICDRCHLCRWSRMAERSACA